MEKFISASINVIILMILILVAENVLNLRLKNTELKILNSIF